MKCMNWVSLGVTRTLRRSAIWCLLGQAGMALAQMPPPMSPNSLPGPPAQAHGDGATAAPSEPQRRTALRAAMVLDAQREADVSRADSQPHQLNPMERAKLREQLRQQRRDALQSRDRSSQ